jgi:ACS family glucarate transporter-like MFS transporter
MPAPETRPASSHVRHYVVSATCLVAVLLYLDRFCVSMAEIYIKEDLGLTDAQVGMMLSAFFWAYALAQVPSGWLADRFGGRWMLTIYVLAWSLFTGLLGVAIGFVMLFALRLAIGVGQAGAYPTAANLVSKWVPFSGRGLASSIIAVGGRVGGALAMVLTGYLIAAFVPLSVPAELTPDDWLDAPGFCHAVAQESAATPRDKAAAAHQRITLRLLRAVELRKLVALADSHGDVTGLRESLTEELNHVVKDADFYRTEDFEFIDLPKEALRYKRVAERGGALKPEELARFNRLLLEGAYPKYIRKIYVHGWRPVMFVYGTLGLLVAGLFWFILRDRPQDHPRCSAAELAVIEHGRLPEATRPDGEDRGVPVKAMLLSRSMWLVNAAQFFTNAGWVFVVTWLPRYLADRHQVPVELRGWMAFIPMFVGFKGMLLGGRLTDWLVRRIGLRWGRALPMSLTRFVGMAAYLYCMTDPGNPWLAVAAFSVVTFSTDLGVASVWAYYQDVSGRYVGSLLGWGNMWGNFAAGIMTSLLIALIGDAMRWEYAFLACAIAFFLSGIAALGVDASKAVFREDDKARDDKVTR